MNGDMVTTSMLQGFLNTFVIFISRILAGMFTSRGDEEEESPNFMYPIIAMLLEFFFGLLVSIILAWYSRIREYAADRDSALKYSSKIDMIDALKKLKWVAESGQIIPDPNNDYVATLKIYNFAGKLLNLFATHPPLEDRIRKLEQL
jgi:heat shock protein HtpX